MTETLEALGTCIARGADPNSPTRAGERRCTGPGDRHDPAIATALPEAGADSAAAVAVVRVEVGRMPDGPICTGAYSPDSCWMEIAGRPGCCL